MGFSESTQSVAAVAVAASSWGGRHCRRKRAHSIADRRPRALLPLSLLSHCLSEILRAPRVEKGCSGGHEAKSRGWKYWQWQIIARFIVFPADLFIPLPDLVPSVYGRRALLDTVVLGRNPPFFVPGDHVKDKKNSYFKSNYKSFFFIVHTARSAAYFRLLATGAVRRANLQPDPREQSTVHGELSWVFCLEQATTFWSLPTDKIEASGRVFSVESNVRQLRRPIARMTNTDVTLLFWDFYSEISEDI